MKRAPFLGAAASAILAGCGGRHVMQALPGVAPSSTNQNPQSTAAEVTPDSVLKSPIIGEARRFDGDAAPALWMLAQGQTLTIAENPMLFRILGSIAGGDGKKTFKLPQPKQGWIVAVAGTFPSSPGVFATLGRNVSHQAGLGAGARVALRIVPDKLRAIREKREAQLLAERRLTTSSVFARPGSPVAVSQELDARFDAARVDARSTSLSSISSANRERVAQLIAASASGRISLNDATLELSRSLSLQESQALLQIHDEEVRRFRSDFAGAHTNPQFEAGRYLMDVALTADERRAVSAMR